MSLSDAEIVEWAKKNKASFEIAPLIDMHEGQKKQVGFELNFYARLPMELPPGPQRKEAGLALWNQMKEIAERLIPADAPNVLLEVTPFKPSARLRPENEMEPEVMLAVRISRAHDYFAELEQRAAGAVGYFERALTGLGLRRGHW